MKSNKNFLVEAKRYLKERNYGLYCLNLFHAVHYDGVGKPRLCTSLGRKMPTLNRDLRIGEHIADFPSYEKVFAQEKFSSRAVHSIFSTRPASTGDLIARLEKYRQKKTGAKGQLPLFEQPGPIPGEVTVFVKSQKSVLGTTVFGSPEEGFWVDVGALCHRFDLSLKMEKRRLHLTFWIDSADLVTGKPEEPELILLHVDKVPMWLATVRPQDVPPEKMAEFANFCLEFPRHLLTFLLTNLKEETIPNSLEEKLDKLTNALLGTGVVFNEGKLSVLPLLDADKKGVSASDIADSFQKSVVFEEFCKEMSPALPLSVDTIRTIASHLGLIGDTTFGLWSLHSTTAFGISGAHWRFNDRGREEIEEVLSSAVFNWPAIKAEVVKVIAKPTGKDILELHLRKKFPKVGTGTFTRLTRDEPRKNGKTSWKETPQA